MADPVLRVHAQRRGPRFTTLFPPPLLRGPDARASASALHARTAAVAAIDSPIAASPSPSPDTPYESDSGVSDALSPDSGSTDAGTLSVPPSVASSAVRASSGFPRRERTFSVPPRFPTVSSRPHALPPQLRAHRLPAHTAAASNVLPPLLNRPRVLVTGGAGFIGSHLCRALLERGESIVIVDELNDYYSPSIKIANLKELIDTFGDSRVHVYVNDVADLTAMEACFHAERFDRIVHLAARAGVRPSIDAPLLYEHANVRGTTALLELYKRHRDIIQHFVYASSSSVYGDDAQAPFNEAREPCNTPVSVYAATKKACEMIAASFAHLHNMPCSGVRPFTVYGPNGRRDMAPFMFIDRMYRGLEITQFGDGSSRRDYTYVSDLVAGIVQVLDHPPSKQPDLPGSAWHEVYNLGCGSPITLRDFISCIASALRVQPSIRQLPKQPGDVDQTFADTSKAHQRVGYSPKVTVQEGVRRTVEWYLQHVAPEVEKERLQKPSLSEKAEVQQQVASPSAAPAPAARADASASSSGDAVATRFPPLQRVLCATRIHNGVSGRVGLAPDMLAHLLQWIPRALACAQHVAIAVDCTDGRTDIRDAVNAVLRGFAIEQRDRVTVLCISPWLAFCPALNALLAHSQSLRCEAILYSSLEIAMHPAHVHSLRAALHEDTLVVGARLPGHRFVRGQAVIDGCATPWNTLALWDTPKLSRTGFLAVSDGLPERHVVAQGAESEPIRTLPAVAPGVEEVACISMQQRLYPNASRAKLLSMTSSGAVCPLQRAAELRAAHAEAGDAYAAATLSDAMSPAEDANRRREVVSFATTSAASGSSSGSEDEAERDNTSRHASPEADSAPSPASSESTSGTVGRMDRSLSAPHAVSAARKASVPPPVVVPSAASPATKTFASASISIPSLHWDASFAGDEERRLAHEQKMRSKLHRAKQQLDALQIPPGSVEHLHVLL